MPDPLDVDLTPAEFKDVSKETTNVLLGLFRDIKSSRVFPGKDPQKS